MAFFRILREEHGIATHRLVSSSADGRAGAHDRHGTGLIMPLVVGADAAAVLDRAVPKDIWILLLTPDLLST